MTHWQNNPQGEIMKKYLALLLSLSLLSTAALAEKKFSKAKKADIQKLMKLTGSSNIGKRISDGMIARLTQLLKAKKPDINSKALKAMQKVVRKTVDENMQGKDGFMKQLIALYHKHFTHEDIKGLILFNKTKLGKKSIKIMPLLSRDSYAAEKTWSRKVIPIIEKRLTAAMKKEGIDLNKK